MNGGIRVPLVMQWPRGIADRGAIRHQWTHVTDLVPTVLDVIGATYPEAFNGLPTRGLDGLSFRAALGHADAPTARRRQHYELAGNRGYIEDGWKIVSLQPPGKAIDLDNWMLFDLARDATETRDLAKAQPERLARLVAAFDADAFANQVYPLDNRGVRRSLTVPPFLEASVNEPRTFYPGAGTAAMAVVAPLVADRDYRLECRFLHSDGDEGVVFALGDPIAGLALFVRDGRLTFVYHGGPAPAAVHTMRATSGETVFALEHRALGARGGAGTITLNGHAAGEIDMSPTTILGLGVGEGLDVGIDRKLHVTPLYGRDDPFAYTGRVQYVRIEPGPHPADSYANRPERLAQRD